MPLPITGNPTMAQNPDNGHTVFNDHLADIENIGHAVKEIDVSAGGTITLTKSLGSDYNSGHKFKFTGNPAGAVTVKFADGDRARLPVESAISTAQAITIDTVTGSTLKPVLVQGETRRLSLDGFQLSEDLLGTTYDFGAGFEAAPAVSTVLGRVHIGRDTLIPADMAGASGEVDNNPAATYDIDVQDDGVSIGTISVATGGAVTFTTTSNTHKNVAAGSVIKFISPAGAEGSIAGFSCVILATLV